MIHSSIISNTYGQKFGMALNDIQQIQSLLEQKKHILITFRKDGKGDAIASAVALSEFLNRLGKRVDIVVDDFVLPKAFGFLKTAETIKTTCQDLQKFIITVDVGESGVKELSYDVQEKKLRIFITPKKGFLSRDHVRTAQSDFKYDLIVVIDTRDLNALGSLYTNNTELFFKTPILNIDHHPANEQFGQINLVDLTVTNTSEILLHLFQKLGNEHIDKDIATALLTGIIVHTRSFKTDNMKPQTLTTASTLMAMGADRECIVTNLYRTRTMATLKLWGQALAHLESDKQTKLVWTSLTREDFVRAGAQEDDLYEIVDELMGNSPEARVTLLMHEHQNLHGTQSIHAFVHTADKTLRANELVKGFSPTGNHGEANVILTGKTLKEAEILLVDEIKKRLLPNV